MLNFSEDNDSVWNEEDGGKQGFIEKTCLSLETAAT